MPRSATHQPELPDQELAGTGVNTEPVTQADLTHRAHAICETVWSDLIDGPWAHQPSGSFPANAAWAMLAAITHNLLRAAGTLTSTTRYALARGATLRTHLINIAARFARPQRRPVLHLPRHWPRATAWLTFWHAVFGTWPHRHTAAAATTTHRIRKTARRANRAGRGDRTSRTRTRSQHHKINLGA